MGQATVLPIFSENAAGTYTMPIAMGSSGSKGPTQMAIAIANSIVGNPIAVDLSILDQNGALYWKSTTPKNLQRLEQTAFFLNEVVSLPPDFKGSVVISSESKDPFSVVGLGTKGFILNAVSMTPLKTPPTIIH